MSMARRVRSNLPEGDDGKTIVDMNVDGMPWYVRDRQKREAAGGKHEEMTPEQLRAYKWAAIRAGLTVALIFGAVFALFIAFCDFVWFK